MHNLELLDFGDLTAPAEMRTLNDATLAELRQDNDRTNVQTLVSRTRNLVTGLQVAAPL